MSAEVPPGATVVHPPHGFVHLERHAADDLAVVNAARVSFGKRTGWVWPVAWGDGEMEYYDAESSARRVAGELRGRVCGPVLAEDDEAVLRFLLRERHGTPFEHTFLTFHVRAPIFVMREWHRHRIGVSVNEESGRYVELAPDFYLPDDEHVRVQCGRPGRYAFEPIGDRSMNRQPGKQDITYGTYVREGLKYAYIESHHQYRELLEAGVAKEIARMCLPVATYSQMYWSCNARSLMNFLSLRNHPRALREIRDYAEAMEADLARLMPITHDQFVKGGRTAP